MGRSLFIVAVVFELFYTEDLHYWILRLRACRHAAIPVFNLDHVAQFAVASSSHRWQAI